MQLQQHQLQLQLHCNATTTTTATTTTIALHYTTPHYIQQLRARWPLQAFQKAQPAFGPSMDSLCHPCITTTHLSYIFSSLKLPPPPCAVLLVGHHLGIHVQKVICAVCCLRFLRGITIARRSVDLLTSSCWISTSKLLACFRKSFMVKYLTCNWYNGGVQNAVAESRTWFPFLIWFTTLGNNLESCPPSSLAGPSSIVAGSSAGHVLGPNPRRKVPRKWSCI